MLSMPSGAKRISSTATGFYKRGLLPLWYGIVVLVAVFLWNAMRQVPQLGYWVFLFPVFMAVLFHVLAKSLLTGLMDEVWDNGKELIVVNEGHVEHLPLNNILNISYSGYTNPKRASLMLRQAGHWGTKIAFVPLRSSIKLFALGDNAMLDELVRRVDEARHQTQT